MAQLFKHLALLVFNVYLFWERNHQWRGRERGRENPKQAPCSRHRAQCWPNLRNHEIMTWAEIKSQSTDWNQEWAPQVPLSVQVLISTQVLISGSWAQALHWFHAGCEAYLKNKMKKKLAKKHGSFLVILIRGARYTFSSSKLFFFFFFFTFYSQIYVHSNSRLIFRRCKYNLSLKCF